MKKSSRGFTLIEIIVTLGILLVLGGVAFLSLSSKRSLSDLTDTSTQIIATLRQAQSDAMAQEGGAGWGVYFSSGATSSYYALFSGSSYASSTNPQRTNLPSDVIYATSSVPANGSFTITFAAVTGQPSTSTAITLYLVYGGGSTGTASSSASINLQSTGKIFFDNFNRTTL